MSGVNIEIDTDLCIGAGECALAASDAFSLGPDDQVVQLLDGASDVDIALLKDAAMMCPTAAITVAESAEQG